MESERPSRALSYCLSHFPVIPFLCPLSTSYLLLQSMVESRNDGRSSISLSPFISLSSSIQVDPREDWEMERRAGSCHV